MTFDDMKSVRLLPQKPKGSRNSVSMLSKIVGMFRAHYIKGRFSSEEAGSLGGKFGNYTPSADICFPMSVGQNGL